MNANTRWIGRVFGGVLAALAAILFSVYAFDILTPPRDINALLNPTRTPLPTPLPTVTAPVAAVPTPPRLLFRDDFSSPGKWPLGNQIRYRPGVYSLLPSPQAEFLAVAPIYDFKTLTYDNLTIETDVTAVSNDPNLAYGLFFWHSTDKQGREQFLSFTLTPNGNYQLQAREIYTNTSGIPVAHWVNLVPLRHLPVIAKSFHLQVQVSPHHVSAFVNDAQVLDRENADVDAYRRQPDYDGQVGLIAIPGNLTNDQVQFTQFDFYTEANSR